MASYTSSAQVVVSVNGRQAQNMLKNLQQEAAELERKIEQAAAAGDKVKAARLQTELNRTRNIMAQLQNTTSTLENTLQNLDRATPKQLNQALRTLRNQLNQLQQGTAAWDAHIQRIRQVQEQLASVNAQLRSQQSFVDRINEAWGKWQNVVTVAAAAFTGFVMAGKSASAAFAEMDEFLADTMKFTGMTKDGVRELNEQFKNMNTRTARSALNELAQEGGRLGKTTLEDVMGYVKGADILNVALSDLGAGATQSIAKLSNIFKIEEMYGTYDAMLKIGSVVNVLSQNCTASKPYLVEFASRLAGVGNQAHISLQNIIGMGAVLDSNAQKVEASATAIGQVLTRMYRDPANYAKVAGLNVKMFADLLKKDANEALLVFLEALGKAGDMDVLSPMFADMGENGARVITALATLSKHIEEVRQQQIVANQAFDEGTSVLHEYNIFNNTAQAGIDKAKKKLSEIAIELGEKLMPVVSHVYSSTSLFLRALSLLVDFVIKFHKPILTLTAAISLYAATLAVTAVRTNLVKVAHVAWNHVITMGRSVLVVFRLAVVAVWNAVTFLTNGFKVSTAMALRWAVVMNKMKFATWTGLILALASAVYLLFQRSKSYSDKMQEIVDKSHDVEEATLKEIKQLDELFGTLEGTAQGTQEYERAKQSILDQYGIYLSGLVNEKNEIIDLEKAYDRLSAAVKRSVAERQIQSSLKQLEETYTEDTSALLRDLRKELVDAGVPDRDVARLMTEVMTHVANREVIPDNLGLEIAQYIAGYRIENGTFTPKGSRFTPGKAIKAIGNFLWNAGATDDADDDVKPSKGIGGLNEIIQAFNAGSESLDGARMEVRPLLFATVAELEREAHSIYDALDNLGSLDFIGPVDNPNTLEWVSVSSDEAALYAPGSPYKHVFKNTHGDYHQAEARLEEVFYELAARGYKFVKGQGIVKDVSENPFGYTPAEKESKVKPARFKEEKEWRELLEMMAKNKLLLGYESDPVSGKSAPYDSQDYNYEMAEILVKYADRILKRSDLTPNERASALNDRQEGLNRQAQSLVELSLEQIERESDERLASIVQDWVDGRISADEYKMRTDLAKAKRLMSVFEFYRKTVEKETEELGTARPDSMKAFLEAEKNLKEWSMEEEKQRAEMRDKQKKEFDEKRREIFEPEAERMKQYQKELALLHKAYLAEVELYSNSAEMRLVVDKAYFKAREKLREKYAGDPASHSSQFARAVAQSVKWLDSDVGKAIVKSYSTLSSGLSDILSQASSLMESQLEIQTAAIEKRYDAELKRAEGNAYQIASIERRKEREVAKAKAEANRKMFAMQVIQAVAQTATSALNAYSSAAAVPVVGYILAPIAAAMATASGLMQVAAIRKQQQASEAQGYAEGGFTRPGSKYEPAGVVHAGEWVASQALVNNPATRPILEALDYAQRTNTVGRLAAADVSRSLTAPMVIAHAAQAPAASVASDSRLSEVVDRLARRLDEPFVTVNTVQGDTGIRQAQLRYQRLIANKSPKSR